MSARIGNFLFHYRNALFPLAYVLLFAKQSLLMQNYKVAALIGFSIALTGQLLRAVTVGFEYIIRGGKNRHVYAGKLVTGGMFAHCRNPLYVGNYLILVGLGVASCSPVFLIAGLPFFAFAYWMITRAEEDYLRNKFGAEFAGYCARVSRYLPNFNGFASTVEGMRYNWRRLLTAEYGSAYVWLAGILLVTLQNTWLAGHYSWRDATVRLFWTLLVLATVAYGVARYLKKSGALKG